MRLRGHCILLSLFSVPLLWPPDHPHFRGNVSPVEGKVHQAEGEGHEDAEHEEDVGQLGVGGLATFLHDQEAYLVFGEDPDQVLIVIAPWRVTSNENKILVHYILGYFKQGQL